MDPVSRRLASAAMGVVFALSRDEELEKTRLDLERSRMTTEDFRQGGGPDTSFMHRSTFKTLPPDVYGMLVCNRRQTMRGMQRHVALELEQWQHQRREAAGALARIARAFAGRDELVILEETQDFFNAYRYDSAEVREFAQDGRGDVDLDLDGDRPSDNETETDF